MANGTFLRLGWRDARRHRGRSLLVLFLIALPVLGVTAADVLIHTADVSGTESLQRRLGAAQAAVEIQPGAGRVAQGADPEGDAGFFGEPRKEDPTLAQLLAALGEPDAPVLERHEGSVRVRTDHGVAQVAATGIDLTDPLATGLFRLTAGAWPDRTGEVVVNEALAERGPDLGETLTFADGSTARVVGIAESARYRNLETVAGPAGSVPTLQDGHTTWLVGGPPVTWQQVLDVNRLGATVLSRHVMMHPPSEAELPSELRGTPSGDGRVLAVVLLVVAMALIEVVLLAGPAFAVGARRQSRNLALVAASGGTPAQARRLVLAGAVVLGGLATVVGVVAGILVARLVEPLAQRLDGSWFGPFQVPWLHLVGIAAFGLLSAVLAAVVPAWLASRQDVVAVLAGRRGDRAPSLRSPVLGLVLVGAGVAGSAYGSKNSDTGPFLIAVSAVVAVLGMILLVPLVLALLARVSRRGPLTWRYAVRDAARHRTRTVPAVAAVAATVSGVVALGIANASDEAANEASYQPMVPMGTGVVTVGNPAETDWQQLQRVVARTLPDVRVHPVRGLPVDTGEGTYTDVTVTTPSGTRLLDGYGSNVGTFLPVSAASVPAGLRSGFSAADLARADARLRSGGAVVFVDHPMPPGAVRISVTTVDGRTGEPRSRSRVRAEAFPLQVHRGYARAQAVLSPGLARRLGVEVATVSLVLDSAPISGPDRRDLTEALGAVAPEVSVYVERGYRSGGDTVVLLWVLAALGGVLMLGGTLTATFLALSDARPDLATLSAVGADPRRRRGVAASYALVVGGTGALLGALVGAIPGVAVARPLTAHQISGSALDVPWVLIAGVVVLLPLATAVVVGLSARSRLPLVARLG